MTATVRFRIAALILLSLLPASEAWASPPPEVQAADYLQQLYRSSSTPGISVAVASKGRIVFSQGAGSVDLDNLVPATGTSVYNIGSVSKVITAVAILELVEQGKIRLDDPIRKYVPSFPDKGAPITLKHLLTHTSGIRHYRKTDFPPTEDTENQRPFATFEEAIKIFKDDPLLFKPGEYYSYSSYAVNLLQGVIEKVTGLPFEDFLRQSVWIPAAMLNTSFDVPERVVPHRARCYRIEKGRALNYYYNDLTYKFASGGMISTVDDLARLGTALNHGQLLKPETLALMYKSQMDPVLHYQEGGPPIKEDFQQGLLWRIQKDDAGRTFIYHCGSVKAFNACLVNYPDEDLVVALAVNSWGEVGGYKQAGTFAGFFRSDHQR